MLTYTPSQVYYDVMCGERVYFDPNVQLPLCCRAYFLVKEFVPDTRDLFDMEILMSISSCECFDKAGQPHREQTQCLHKLLKSAARREYELIYRDEILLNEKFRQFVMHFKHAYEGENTKKKQVDNKHATQGSKSYLVSAVNLHSHIILCLCTIFWPSLAFLSSYLLL